MLNLLFKNSMNRFTFLKFKQLVSMDLSRYQETVSCSSFIKACLLYPGFRFVFLLRICRYFRWHPILKFASPFFIILFWRMQRVYGLSISYGTNIGGGFYIPHIGLGVINPATIVGDNVYLAQGVTIGKAHAGLKAGSPIIGNGVFLGPNACVFGSITLGDHVAVGANSVVLSDVPSGVTVAGAPARVVSDKGADHILGRVQA